MFFLYSDGIHGNIAVTQPRLMSGFISLTLPTTFFLSLLFFPFSPTRPMIHTYIPLQMYVLYVLVVVRFQVTVSHLCNRIIIATATILSLVLVQ